MAALMAALFAVALIEGGGRPSWLAAMLGDATRHPATAASGMLVALAIILGAGAAAGTLIGAQLAPAPRSLFLGLALISAGVGALPAPRPPDRSLRGGPFVGGVVGTLALMLGGSSQFVVVALAARDPLPYVAAAGGWLGAGVMVVGMTVLGEAGRSRLPLVAFRYGGGGVLIAAGIIAALSGFRLL